MYIKIKIEKEKKEYREKKGDENRYKRNEAKYENTKRLMQIKKRIFKGKGEKKDPHI